MTAFRKNSLLSPSATSDAANQKSISGNSSPDRSHPNPGRSGSEQSGRHIVLGILAHVDAGKTTLSERLLYLSGSIRKIGRVDHGDTVLDTDSMERQRGITIFSKVARLELEPASFFTAHESPSQALHAGRGSSDAPSPLSVTLLDTPGHADFSPEMERTLSVLDYALLVISGPDGVTGQVKTLWKLLDHYRIPTFLFVNKMDQAGTDAGRILADLQGQLSEACLAMPDPGLAIPDPETAESLALCDDRLLTAYLEEGRIPSREDISWLIASRKLFPVFFGSALKGDGAEALVRGLLSYTEAPALPSAFCAKVFKITRDPSGARLTWMRVLGGSLAAKAEVRSQTGQDGQTLQVQKVDQVRLYSGESFATVREVSCGQVVCAAGLTGLRPGQVLIGPETPTACIGRIPSVSCAAKPESGCSAPASVPAHGPASASDRTGELDSTASGSDNPVSALLADSLLARTGQEQLILPILTSRILSDDETDPATLLKDLRILEEEEPMLGISCDTTGKEISAQIMGQVETEILRDLCLRRFGIRISFGPPTILYRETIAGPVEGVGHYEPLRHYAEVHLLLEPAERGSGITLSAQVSQDLLAGSWQRLVLSSLASVRFRGVLTGSELTDLNITLIGGKASEKHTEGGDFRQASIRAVRQGLMSAQTILLEPWYRFEASLPQGQIGRLVSDVRKMEGQVDPIGGDGETAQVTGSLPAAEVADYAAQVRAYTHGLGRITFSLKGYEPCRHPEEVILQKGYDPASDLDQPADSVFCSHGAGVTVPWDQVRDYMHVDTGWGRENAAPDQGDWNCDDSGSDGQGQDAPGQASFSSDWRAQQSRPKQTWKDKDRARSAGEDELRQIFERTYKGSSWQTPLHASANAYGPDDGDSGGLWSRDGSLENWGKSQEDRREKEERHHSPAAREDYLLVDGYNIIFAWKELRDLASINIDAAAGKLVDILSDYQGSQGGRMIIVFDAYKVPGGKRHISRQGKVDIIYTKEAETADSYIMELTHTLAGKGSVTVATGDGIVQMIIFSAGARRMSAAELLDRVQTSRQAIRETYHTDRP